MKKIAIFGGGVGGLTVAHELSKNPWYQINVYEKKNEIGGLARSFRDPNDKCTTEYCWRVFFGFYHNILKIFEEIPLMENETKTVLNNLTEYRHLNVMDSKFLFKDKLIGAYNILYGLMSCDARLDEMDHISWWEALKTASSSNLFREIGGWLGMDRYKGSYRSVIKVGIEMQIVRSLLSFGKYKDWITTQPTSEAWFDHWKKYLEKNQVHFHMNTELIDIEKNQNKIVSANVINYNNDNNQIKKIIADYYVFAIPIETLNEIIEKTHIFDYQMYKNIQILKNTCLHIQLSFQVYFNRSISFGNNKRNAFLLIDSPWDLIVLSYDQAYNNNSKIICQNNSNIKGAWSIAVCTAYIPGIVFDKPFIKCSYEEIITEIWAQLLNSPKLKKIVKENNSFILNDTLIVKWSRLWSSFYYDKTTNTLKTMEPKFTNNIGSYNLRPSFRTEYKNLYIATAYIKETIDIFSMEGACIAGKLVAHDISKECNYPIFQKRPILFSFFRFIDKFCYHFKFPNIFTIINISIFIFIIVIFLVIIGIIMYVIQIKIHNL